MWEQFQNQTYPIKTAKLDESGEKKFTRATSKKLNKDTTAARIDSLYS